MDKDRPMTLLLIEDEACERNKYKDCAAKRTDVRFIGMTGSSMEGIDYLKTHIPEGVILDLELTNGKGSGLQFLQDMCELKLSFRPLVFVITNSASKVVYNHIHAHGTDLVFYKRQADYSADMVLNSMIALRKALHTVKDEETPDELRGTETPAKLHARITDRLNAEFDAIGIGQHLKGHQYLFEAIYLLLTWEGDLPSSIIQQVSNRHKHAYSTINRAMQAAINYAWKVSSIDDLQAHYTARINYQTGIPTPTEFIYHYFNKLKNTL